MQDSRAESWSQIQQLQNRLEGAEEELLTSKKSFRMLKEEHELEKGNLQSALEKKSRGMEDMRSQNTSLIQSALDNEQRLLKLQSEHESLIDSHNRKEEANKELLSLLERLKLQVAKEEKTWLEEKENILSVLEVSQKESMDRKLEVERLSFDFEKQKIQNWELENQSKSCREEVLRLCLELDKTNKELHKEKSESDKMKAEYTSKSFAFHAALESRESFVKQLEARVQDLELELGKKDEMINGHVLKIESMEAEVKDKCHKMESLESMKKSLQARLSETAEELQKSKECRIASEAKLVEYEERFIPAKLELEAEVRALKEICSSSKLKLQQALEQVQGLNSEKEAMIQEISNREKEVIVLKNQTDSLLYEKERSKESFEALLGKMKSQDAEMEEQKIAVKILCNSLEAAEESLASKSEETRQLGVKLEIAERAYCELREAKQKIVSLEEKVVEVTLLLQEKEENLSASEWAVEQVANEISKAKNALSQKEKEYGSLAKKLADAEFMLRAKGGEMMEMESCFQALSKKHSSKKAELEIAKQALLNYETQSTGWKRMEVELRDQIEALRSSVEEKTAELLSVQAELQGKSETQIMMEGAIQKLKAELAEEGKSSLQRHEEMEKLCGELQASRQTELLDAQELREAQAKLQCLEQSSLEQEHKFRRALSELEEQLDLAHLKQSSYEKELSSMLADLQAYEEKCSCLRDELSLKDSSLADMKSALESLRFDFTQQSKSTDEHLLELNDVRKELSDKIEKERELVELISSFKGELIDKELQRQELEQDIEKLQYQLKASSAELEVKSKEVNELNIKLEQVEILSCERDDKLKDLIVKLTEELNDAVKSIKDRDDAISDMESTLKESIAVQRNLEDVIETKAKEHSDVLDRLNATEINVAKLQDSITKLTEELNDSVKSIKDRDDALFDMESSFKESLAVQRNLEDVIEIKGKELSDALYQMNATEIDVAKLQDSITKLTEELNDAAKLIKDRDDAISNMESTLKESLAVRGNLEDVIEIKVKEQSDALDQFNATKIDAAKLQNLITKFTEELHDSAKLIKDRDYTISDMEISLKESLAIQRNLEDVIETKAKEHSDALDQLNTTRIDIAMLQDSITKLTEELNHSAKSIKDRDDAISEMEISLKESLAVQRNLEDVIETKGKELSDALYRINTTEIDAAKLQDSIAKLTEELNDSAKLIKDRDDAIFDMDNSLKEFLAMQRNLEDIIDTKAREHSHAIDQLNTTEIDVTKFQDSITKLTEELIDSAKLIKDRDYAISEMENSLKESLAVQKNLEGVIETKGMELSDAIYQLNATKIDVAKLQDSIAKLTEKLNDSAELIKDRDAIISDMENSLKEHLALQRNLDDVIGTKVKEHRDALDRLNATEINVAKLQNSIAKLTEELNDSAKLIKDRDDTISDIENSLKESLSMQRNLEDVIETKAKEHRDALDQLNATEINVAKLQASIMKLTEELDDLPKLIKDRDDAISDMKSSLKESLAVQRNLEDVIETKGKELSDALDRLNATETYVAKLQGLITGMEDEMDRRLSELKAERDNVVALTQVSEDLEAERDMWKQTASSLDGTSDAIKAHLTEVLETVKELHGELKTTKQEKESFESTVHDLRSSLDDALCKLKAECNESEYLKKSLMDLEGELSEWKQKHEEDSMALEMKGKELECTCQELQKAMEQLESLQKAIDAKSEEEEEGKKKLHSATELASNLELEVKEWKEMVIAAKKEQEVGSRVTHELRTKLNAMEVERRDLDQLCLKLQNEVALSQEEILERKETWKKASSQIEISQEGRQKLHTDLHSLYSVVIQQVGAIQENHLKEEGDLIIDNAGETISHSGDLHQHDEARGPEEHLRCLNEELEKALAELAAKNKELEILKAQANNNQDETAVKEKEELYHYLELCDSLIRKEGVLERQLESLQRKNKRLQKQVDSVQRPDAKGSEKTSSSLILDGDNQEKQRSGDSNRNRKRIGETEASSTVSCLSGKFSCIGRLPLQMVQCQTLGSPAQAPIQKRRRSNNIEEQENMDLACNHSYRQL